MLPLQANTRSQPCKLKVIFYHSRLYELYISEPYYYDIPEIDAGGSCTIELCFSFGSSLLSPSWEIEAKADGEDTVKEADENNNKKRLSFFISPSL